MDVALAYGSTGLTVRLPAAQTTVIAPRPRTAAPDPLATLRAAIDGPVAGPRLRDIVRAGQRVAISVCDVTRPQPRALMLGALMEVLDGVIRPEDVVVLIATGTHRASSDEERRVMLGDEVLGMWRVVDHDARDRANLVDMGMVGDVPVHLDRRLGRGGRADHDRVRRAALLRRVQRRTEDGRAWPRRARHDARAAQRPPDRRPAGDLGGHRREPGPRCRPGDRRGHAASTSRSTCSSTTSSASRAPSRVRSSRCMPRPAPRHAARRCARSPRRSTSSSRPTAATRSTRTSIRR